MITGQYYHLSRTRKRTKLVGMIMWIGETSWGPITTQGTTGTKETPREGKLAIPKDEPLDWFPST